MRAEAAYFWDASVPVEMAEIDSIDTLDAAVGWSVDNNQPIIIDWYVQLPISVCPPPTRCSFFGSSASSSRLATKSCRGVVLNAWLTVEL